MKLPMHTLMIAALVAVFAINTPVAKGQQISTVGDILDHGGKRLTKDEVQRLFSGAIVSGIQRGNSNTRFRNKDSPDGTVTGDAWHGGAWFTKITGTWSVNDAGQFCEDLRNDRNFPIQGCSFYYQLGDRYFAGDTDRSAPVNEREFAH